VIEGEEVTEITNSPTFCSRSTNKCSFGLDIYGYIFYSFRAWCTFCNVFFSPERESPKERYHLEDQGVGGKIGSDWILGRLALGVWIGFDWLRTGTGGGLLWVRWWTFGFLRHGVSFFSRNGLRTAADHLASRRGSQFEKHWSKVSHLSKSSTMLIKKGFRWGILIRELFSPYSRVLGKTSWPLIVTHCVDSPFKVLMWGTKKCVLTRVLRKGFPARYRP
jgi:hypothetical protein